MGSLNVTCEADRRMIQGYHWVNCSACTHRGMRYDPWTEWDNGNQVATYDAREISHLGSLHQGYRRSYALKKMIVW